MCEWIVTEPGLQGAAAEISTWKEHLESETCYKGRQLEPALRKFCAFMPGTTAWEGNALWHLGGI